jgi:hypothetical protein
VSRRASTIRSPVMISLVIVTVFTVTVLSDSVETRGDRC